MHINFRMLCLFFLLCSSCLHADESMISFNVSVPKIISDFDVRIDVSSSLVGLDANRNNVRDDIDFILSKLYLHGNTKKIIDRYVNYSFRILSHDFSSANISNEQIANKLYDEYRYIRHCYQRAEIDGKELYDSINIIDSLIFNTDARITGYLNYEKYINIHSIYSNVTYLC